MSGVIVRRTGGKFWLEEPPPPSVAEVDRQARESAEREAFALEYDKRVVEPRRLYLGRLIDQCERAQAEARRRADEALGPLWRIREIAHRFDPDEHRDGADGRAMAKAAAAFREAGGYAEVIAQLRAILAGLPPPPGGR